MIGWQIKLISVLVIVSAVAFWYDNTMKTIVRETTDKVTLDIETKSNKQLVILKEKAKATEAELSKVIETNQKEYNDKIKDINTKHDAMLVSLRNRPTGRSTEVTVSSTVDTTDKESTTGSTGSKLPRLDVESFVEFSTKAERLKLEILTCYNQYDLVREKYNGFILDNSKGDTEGLEH